MRNYRDLGVLGLVLLLAVLVVLLFDWATTPWVDAAAEEERRTAIAAIADGAPVGEPREPEAPAVRRLYPLGGELQERAIAEIAVTGYRGRIRLLVRLGAEGEIEEAVVLRESENPAYDWFFRDSTLLTDALAGRGTLAQDPGASVALRAIRNGIAAAQVAVTESPGVPGGGAVSAGEGE